MFVYNIDIPIRYIKRVTKLTMITNNLRPELDARRLEKRIIKWSMIIIFAVIVLGAMHYDHQLLEAGLIN